MPRPKRATGGAGRVTATAIIELPITAPEARLLTDRIKAAAEHLWALLLEAHERQAWKALEYPSFTAYAKAEFGMGASHAYRLLDQGRVIRALEAVTHSPVGEIVSERIARDIKPHLVEVTAEIGERMERGEAWDAAVDAAIQDARKPVSYLGARKRVDRPNRCVESAALDLKAVWIDWSGMRDIRVSALDQSRIEGWAKDLRSAARAINAFAARLERDRRP